MKNFIKFVKEINNQVSKEPEFEIHKKIIDLILPNLFVMYPEIKGSTILDIGIGNSLSTNYFLDHHCKYFGITLCQEELNIATQKEYSNVFLMDQSFLSFKDNTFDFIYCRHTLEHSFMPLYTLYEFKRVLKNHGLLYIEVPATSYTDKCEHENNPEHYSILTNQMWVSLFNKLNYKILDNTTYDFKEHFSKNGITNLVDCQFLMYMLRKGIN